MQIGSNVPNMIGTAALQFTAYLAQTSLEASIRRRKNKGNSQKSILRPNPEFSYSGSILGISDFFIFNPYWQISWKFLRPFYWKTHPLKNQFSGRELDRFSGKLIQTK